MTAQYSRLPTNEETAIDFSSIFTSEKSAPPKYFSYSTKSSDYKSIFTYSKSDDEDVEPVPFEPPGIFPQFLAGFITFVCYVLVFVTFPLNFWLTLKKVKPSNTMVIYRLGRLLAPKKPGYTVILPCLDKCTAVDVGIKAFSVPPQKIITSDGAIIEAGGDVFYQITDPALCISGVVDLQSSMRTLCLTVLKNRISKCELHTMTHQSYSVVETIKEDINKATSKWGVTISKVELPPIKVLDDTRTQPNLGGFGGIDPVNILTSLLPNGLSQAASGNMNFPMPMPITIPQAQPSAIPTQLLPPQPQQPASDAQLSRLLKEGSPSELRSIIDMTRSLITPELIRECDAVYKFAISDSPGRVFFLDLKNAPGSCGIGEPSIPPDATITVSSTDALQIYKGQLSVINAYFTGSLAVDGDLQAAKRLRALSELKPQ